MPDSPSWADTAASLLSKLSGGVELNLAFDQVELQVPNPNGTPGTYRLNGSLRIRTRGDAAPAAQPAPAAALRIDPPAPSGHPQPLG
ncbi:hypothetical protein ACFQ48_18020 [Hymenobacter caeli]|uniref:Uncharacterized protein n=1 Tax=Hymenobacter caeli TaxID=2735894 RepID=A0ABX2FUN4_9BACT|nr:hypothetical protein [Hymenobacter caeli]NRT20895.1 hypothetical protein [Hymenobacter caeli]